MKKLLNVLGVIIALLLSLELIIMLVLTPVVFSALSLLKTQTVIELLEEALEEPQEDQPSAAVSNIKATTLSVTIPPELAGSIPSDIAGDISSDMIDQLPEDVLDQLPEDVRDQLPEDILDKIPDEIPDEIPEDILSQLPTDVPENVPVDKFVENVGKEMLEKYLGDSVSDEQITAILTTNTAKELLVAYAEDLTNIITGKTEEPAKFTTEAVKEIVNKNIDEVVEVLQVVVPEYAEKDVEEIKTSIQEVVEERADEIIQSIPHPEVVKQQIAESSPVMDKIMQILAMQDAIELMDIGIIALLCALIFVCRLKGFRGFCWIATDLFIACGINGIICAGLRMSASAVDGLVKQVSDRIADVIGSLLFTFTDAILTRTLIMLVHAVVFLVIYIIIKKHKAKKKKLAAELRAQEATA